MKCININYKCNDSKTDQNSIKKLDKMKPPRLNQNQTTEK